MSDIPRPGKPVRGSTSGRPIMALLDLLGQRWVLRILWELRGEPLGFRALQAACDGMSPSVLRDRLEALRAAGLVAQHPDSTYALSGLGSDLAEAFEPLSRFAERWAASVENDS